MNAQLAAGTGSDARTRLAGWAPSWPGCGMRLPRGAAGTRLLGVRQQVAAPVVVDGDEALLNVDVGGAVLAHGAQLDQVAVGAQLLRGGVGASGGVDVDACVQ